MSQVLPHDTTAEDAVIGRMLVAPHVIGEVSSVLGQGDFHQPIRGEVFGLLVEAWRTGEPLDSVSLVAACPSVTPGDAAQLLADAPAGHQRLVEHLVALRVRRDLIKAASEITASARDLTVDPVDARDSAAQLVDAIDTPLEPVGDLWRFDAFMDQPANTDPWVIPGMFKAGWRAIVVATEGRGKSWLSRQIASAAACGVHPLMTTDDIQPITTLIVDLENPADSITAAGKRMRDAAGTAWAPERVFLWHRPGGINIRRRHDRSQLEAVIAECRPEFVTIGPLYKAYTVSSREADEQAAGEVQAVLDDLRTRYGFALLLEHHAPKGTGNIRDILPYGSSFWLRWPELGIKLTPHADFPDKLVVGRWRLDRTENRWPDRLERSTRWPWIGEWDKPYRSKEAA